MPILKTLQSYNIFFEYANKKQCFLAFSWILSHRDTKRADGKPSALNELSKKIDYSAVTTRFVLPVLPLIEASIV